MNDLENGRRYGELAATVGHRAEPLYDLVFYLHRHEQYALAWYYCNWASRIPKPTVDKALFISIDIYHYWLDYEKATLCRHVLYSSSHTTACLEFALAFLNNAYAPDSLRQCFYENELPLLVSRNIMDSEIVELHFYKGIATEPEFVANKDWRRLDNIDKQGAPNQGHLLTTLSSHGQTFCVLQWHPLQIGKYMDDDGSSMGSSDGACTCSPHSTIESPRSLSFAGDMFATTITATSPHHDAWILIKSKLGTGFYQLMILDAKQRIKGFTYPFLLDALKDGEPLSGAAHSTTQNDCFHMSVDKEAVYLRCHHHGGDHVYTAMHKISLAKLAPILAHGV